MLDNWGWGRIGSWLGLAAIGLALAACGVVTPTAAVTAKPPAATSTRLAATATATPRPPTATASATHWPTLTFIAQIFNVASPTPSPSPSRLITLTPTGEPTKQVLIRFANRSGGDGSAGAYGGYFGYHMPDWVLYTDGQWVMTDGNWMADGQQASLTTAQMCRLLSQIEGIGFFEVEGDGGNDVTDPVYNFPVTPEVSYGDYDYYLQVNGHPAKYVRVYWPYEPYVVPAVRAAYNLLHDYRPANLIPFQGTKLMMWVEAGRGFEPDWLPYAPDVTATATPAVDMWPDDLPPLTDLLPIPNGIDVWDGTPLYVQGDLAARLLNLPKRYGLYTDHGQEYLVFIRPLLPDETAEGYPVFVSGAAEFDLPFTCD
jgi:hypothetical protein